MLSITKPKIIKGDNNRSPKIAPKRHKFVKRNVNNNYMTEKHIEKSLDYITQLKNLDEVHLEFSDKVVYPATVTKKDTKGYELQFEKKTWNDELGVHKGITLKNGDLTLVSNRLFVNSISPPVLTATINEFCSENFNSTKNLFQRLIIPTKKKIDFIFNLESLPYVTVYKNIKSHLGFARIRLKIDNKTTIDVFHIHIKENGEYYLFIDSLNKCSAEIFEQYCFSILITLGFLSGQFIQDEGYFFSSHTKKYESIIQLKYSTFRNSIYSSYQPVYTNSYGFIEDKIHAKRLYETINPISLSTFEKLTDLIYGNIQFRSVLLLIIESMNSSLMVMSTGLSVALEGLTSQICEENEKTLAPIKSKAIAKKVRSELNSTILPYKGYKDSNGNIVIDDDGFEILTKKINDINQLTNAAKLTKPFSVLGLNISDYDKKIISHRNDFLHGRLNLTVDSKTHPDYDNIDKKVFHISLKLYTLNCMLILKNVGHIGKILNYPKIHDSFCRIGISEDYCIEI